MSSPPAAKPGSPPQQGPSSDCALEAAKLLNCVAAKNYSKEECVAALDALRACVRKNRVVDFTLLPEEAEPKEEKRTS